MLGVEDDGVFKVLEPRILGIGLRRLEYLSVRLFRLVAGVFGEEAWE
ncbi:MAG: hypothetical protein QW304_08190 [Thermoproteota archaeon]